MLDIILVTGLQIIVETEKLKKRGFFRGWVSPYGPACNGLVTEITVASCSYIFIVVLRAEQLNNLRGVEL